MTRLLLDASVLLSAAAAHPGTPLALLLAAVEDGDIEMIACKHLLEEVRRGLQGTYFRDRLPDDDRDQIPEGLERIAVMHADPESPPSLLRDPDDDYLVALARSSKAEAIVTGDADLLDHDGLEPPAITPREACTRLGLN